jgi:hypothetical protein
MILVVCLILVPTFQSVQSAQPQVLVPTASTGISIEHPISDLIFFNQSHEFNFHLYNSSNGKPILNTTTIVCIFHLYNSSGVDIFEDDDVKPKNQYDWMIMISAENFSYVGQYAYVFQCNTSDIGGFYAHDFYSTPQGQPLAGDNFRIFIWVLFIIALIGIISTLFLSIAKIATTSETIYGVLISWGFVLLLLVVDFLAKTYLLTTFITTVTTPMLTAVVWTNTILPVIGLMITLIAGALQKKRLYSVQEILGQGGFRNG